LKIGEQLREHRDKAMLTQDELGKRAGLSGYTISRIESDQVEPRVSTMRKIAGALGIKPEELTARPKVQTSLWPEEGPERRNPEPSDAQRRLAKVNKLAAEYLAGRAEQHDAEVTDPNSPHFANATAATLWLAGVEDELAAWLDWREELQGATTPAGEDFGATVATIVGRALVALGAVLAFDSVTERAEERIKAMNDAPDELAARRLEVSTAAREASRKRLEDPREAASGG